MGVKCLLYFNLVEPVDPVRPEDITFVDVMSDSVIIQWTIPYISYSPETYVVQYGTSRDSLTHNSSSTHSEEEVMTYSVELSGLRDTTTYYVQVLATNTAQRSNRSTVHKFITLPLEPGMQNHSWRSRGRSKVFLSKTGGGDTNQCVWDHLDITILMCSSYVCSVDRYTGISDDDYSSLCPQRYVESIAVLLYTHRILSMPSLH